MTTAVCFAVILLAGLLLLQKKRAFLGLGARLGGGRNGASKRVDLVARTHLSPSASVHVVQIEDRILVIATHGNGCRLLARWRESPAGEVRARAQVCGD